MATYEPRLTKRQTEILRLLVEGFNNHEIAEMLGIAPSTVFMYRKHIMVRLRINELAGLVKYALINGLTSVDQHRVK